MAGVYGCRSARWALLLGWREGWELILTRLESELASVSDGVGDAGSPTDIERVVLGDGSSAVIGSLAAGGEGSIASWFGGVVAETHYARLFAFLEQLSRRTQSGLARVWTTSATWRSQRSLLTEARSKSRATYGSARRTSDEVACPTPGGTRGIASMLLGRVATRARAAGIEQLIAICLATDRIVVRLLSGLERRLAGRARPG